MSTIISFQTLPAKNTKSLITKKSEKKKSCILILIFSSLPASASFSKDLPLKTYGWLAGNEDKKIRMKIAFKDFMLENIKLQ